MRATSFLRANYANLHITKSMCVRPQRHHHTFRPKKKNIKKNATAAAAQHTREQLKKETRRISIIFRVVLSDAELC
jgi:hypothetical protein